MGFSDRNVKNRVGAGQLGGEPAEAATAAHLRSCGLEVVKRGLHETSTASAVARKLDLRDGHQADLTVHDPTDRMPHAGVVHVEVKGGKDGVVTVKLRDLLVLRQNELYFRTPVVVALWDQSSETVHYATLAALRWVIRQPSSKVDVLDLETSAPKICVRVDLNHLARWEVARTVLHAALRDVATDNLTRGRQRKIAAAA
jgi:hypothetical protein